MEKEKNLLDQYEALPAIEASESWEERLWQRIEQTPRRSGPNLASGAYLTLICALGLLNLFVLIDADRRTSASKNAGFSSVAHEFLIHTSSSNY